MKTGQIKITAKAIEAIASFEESAVIYMILHHDLEFNCSCFNKVEKPAFAPFSTFKTPNGDRLWVTTKSDFSETLICLAYEEGEPWAK